jgi:sulfate/thiosulfate transport system substrate-binding protein
MSIRRTIAPLAALLGTAVLIAGCGGSSDSTSDTASSGKGGAQLSLVAYSTPQVVYDEVIPAFEKTQPGEGTSFKSSYGASGEQSRAVEAGLTADVVAFSLAPDINRLVKAGKVAEDWDQNEYKGFVSNSLVSFVVRKGNPKNIHTWADLLKPGVQVLTPNPFTSGAAKWNLLGAYVANGGVKDPQKGLDYLRELLTKHVKVQDKSGREALQNFVSGNGDVLISYEYEAITAQKKGEKGIELVQPQDTILIQNPIAVTSDSEHAEQAKAFVDYAWSKPAQEVFASWGYRPVNQEVLAEHKADFPDPKQVYTIDDLGGWSKVNDELFDPEKGSVAKIENDAGVSTEQ